MDLQQFSATLGLAAGLSFNSLLALLLVGVAQRAGLGGFDSPASRLSDPFVLGLVALLAAGQLVAERRKELAEPIERARTPLALLLGAAIGGVQAEMVGLHPILMALATTGVAGATRATSKVLFAPLRPVPRMARAARKVESGLASLFVLVSLSAGQLALPLLALFLTAAWMAIVLAVLAGVLLGGRAVRGVPMLGEVLRRWRVPVVAPNPAAPMFQADSADVYSLAAGEPEGSLLDGEDLLAGGGEPLDTWAGEMDWLAGDALASPASADRGPA